jgi:hypothetical protein
MNTPLLIQNSATSVVVYLELEAGGAATGLLFSDVTAGLKKAGAGSFSAFTLTALNFTDLGNGFYEVDLAAGDTNTLGTLYLSFTGATIRSTLVVAYVTTAATAPPIPTPAFTPTVTAIFGYIYDSAGQPVEDVTVVARITQQPTIIHPTTDGILIGANFLTTTTDATGFFTLSLLTGATVEFVITDANYRRTVTIPGSTINLFDIP